MGRPVVHFEIGCRDSAKAQAFYSKLFDWNFDQYGNSVMIRTGAPPGVGINGHITTLGHEPHNYITIYAQVDDMQATLAKATELGGKTLVPMTEVPNLGHFAWIADPEGTVIGLWKPFPTQ
jgi:predicted enzyme related to lactoylglutathione lyase